MSSRYSRKVGQDEMVPLPEDLFAWMDADDWDVADWKPEMRAGDIISRDREWKEQESFRQPDWLTDFAQGSEDFGQDLKWLATEAPGEFIDWIRGLMSGKQFSPRGEMENFQELESEETPTRWRPGRKWDPPPKGRTY